MTTVRGVGSSVDCAVEKPEVYEVAANATLSIPLTSTRRGDFSGANLQLRTMGCGFEGNPLFDFSLTADGAEAVLDLATLKPAPGDYLIAFYGGAVAKYRHHPEQVALAETEQREAQEALTSLDAELAKLTDEAQKSPVEKKESAEKAVAEATARRKAAATALSAAADRVKNATAVSQPQDIVDIVVSEPISIRVKPFPYTNTSIGSKLFFIII